jgi:hypothetical protein
MSESIAALPAVGMQLQHPRGGHAWRVGQRYVIHQTHLLSAFLTADEPACSVEDVCAMYEDDLALSKMLERSQSLSNVRPQ